MAPRRRRGKGAELLQEGGGGLRAARGIGVGDAPEQGEKSRVEGVAGVGFLDRRVAEFGGAAAGGGLGEEDAERKKVGGEAAVLLAGDIPRGADDGGGLPRVGEQAGVGEDRLPVEVEDVGRLDVAVDEAVALEEVEG